jgi:predicted ATPase
MQVLKLLSELACFHETHNQPSQAETYTRQQLALDPLQEVAHRRLMRLLHHQGRRAAALAQFAICRDVLAAELGLEPEHETTVLYAQLKAHVPPAVSSTPWPLADTTLPDYLTPFIGRETELAAIGERLRAGHERLITLVGPGGIGKTRLAQQVASTYGAMFRDGACFVPLAQTPTVGSIPAAIVEALGLSFVASQRSPVEQLIEMLAGRQLLLVLDNFEHLIDGATLLLRLVQAAPQLVLLVTTRERLNLQAEDLFELDGLPTPASSLEVDAEQFAAVRLFLDRAQRVSKRQPISAAHLPQIVQICRLVEGFPLAIELAATWTRDLSCQEIVAELSGGLSQLETTLRDIAPHHRSLRAVFEASWRLLSEAEQRALMLLAVFRGGVTRDAARAIAGASAALLSGLRDKSLLRPAGARRYDMHAVVQQFAAEALTADPQAAERAHRDHSRYFLTILAAQAVALDTRDARAAADAIQLDWENISRAWQSVAQSGEHALLEGALDGLVRFCNLRGLFQEAQIALERALLPPSSGAHEPAPPLLHCRLLTARAYMAGRRRLEQTLTLAQQALALAEQLEDRQAIIENLIIQSNAYRYAADHAQARALAEHALVLAQANGLEVYAGLCLHSLGVIGLLMNEFERASTRFQQVLAIHRRTGRLEQCGREAIGRLGTIASEQGRHDTALQYLQDYLASCERMGDRRNIVHAEHHLAFVWLKLGEYGRVIQIMAQNIPRARALGDRELASLGLHVQAWAQRALGQLGAALASANEAVMLARASQARLALAFALHQLAETELEHAVDTRDWAQAADCFQEAAACFRVIGKEIMTYEAEIGLAELHRRRGALAAASELIKPILPQLPSDGANGWDAPLRAYVVCVQILRAAADPGAELILDQGLRLLDALAQNIGDQRLRRSFLQAIASHHELRALRAAAMDAAPKV